MGRDDEKSLSQSFVPWDKKHMNVSQEEACHGQWLMLKTFFTTAICTSLITFI